jgi:3-oxoacyl-[acyl-carrier-protein] synthase III
MSPDPSPPAGTRITGTGIAVPERVVTSTELEASLGVSATWVVERTGVHERRLVEPNGQRATELGALAAARALEDARLMPTDLDLLICATVTAEMATPATSCRIVDRLGATPCGAFDLSIACSGFVAGLNMAANFVTAAGYRHVLVVGTEVVSEITDWSNPRTACIFGDGAAAAIVSASPQSRGCMFQKLGSDASRWHELFLPRRSSDIPAGMKPTLTLGVLHMDGPAVFRFAVTTFQRIITEALDACHLKASQVKRFILHQANARILEKVRAELCLSHEQVPVNIDRYGNTSATSIGLVLHEVRESGQLRSGDIVLFAAVGGGMSWGTSVWRW